MEQIPTQPTSMISASILFSVQIISYCLKGVKGPCDFSACARPDADYGSAYLVPFQYGQVFSDLFIRKPGKIPEYLLDQKTG